MFDISKSKITNYFQITVSVKQVLVKKYTFVKENCCR